MVRAAEVAESKISAEAAMKCFVWSGQAKDSGPDLWVIAPDLEAAKRFVGVVHLSALVESPPEALGRSASLQLMVGGFVGGLRDPDLVIEVESPSEAR